MTLAQNFFYKLIYGTDLFSFFSDFLSPENSKTSKVNQQSVLNL